ncbi:MAG: hypothetical protein AAF903_03505 [Pseudomonadota bacterium]
MKSALTSIALALLATTAAHGASSQWFETEGAKIRLVGLPSADGKMIDAGLQIELEEGWKTYWKSPGASGLPPTAFLCWLKKHHRHETSIPRTHILW